MISRLGKFIFTKQDVPSVTTLSVYDATPFQRRDDVAAAKSQELTVRVILLFISGAGKNDRSIARSNSSSPA